MPDVQRKEGRHAFDTTVGLWNGLGIGIVILAIAYACTMLGKCTREIDSDRREYLKEVSDGPSR